MQKFDVIVIGGGLLGCFAARSLTRYDLSVALLEKREDLCTGISRANTAIVYSGSDMKPGSLKASMCVRASQGFAGLCDELGVRYSPCGSLMICFGERGASVLRNKFRDGAENGVRGIKLLTREEVLELEPNIAGNVHSGLFAPDAGTVMPWELCLAAAENAAKNGASILLNTEVLDVAKRQNSGFEVSTSNGTFFARAIVNCAGMSADRVFEMASEPMVRIRATAGDYYILDTKAAGHIRHIIFHEPEEKGKGLTLVPTVDGNILVGPTERSFASELKIENGKLKIRHDGMNSEFFSTSREGLELLRELVSGVVPSLPMEHIISSFGAVRPNPYMLGRDANGNLVEDEKSVNDFCIVESESGTFISLIGVKTPGLTCADELGAHTANKIAARLGAAPNAEFDPVRPPPVRRSEYSIAEWDELVRKNPDYGNIPLHLHTMLP